jgi:putative salt-induced outer membrane protein YdiY
MLKILSLLLISTQIMASVPTDKEGLSGNFDLGLNFTKNTENTFQFNNVFLVKYKKGKSNFSLGNNISFISKTGEDDLLNKGTQDFKYALDAKKLDANITLQHMYDISRSVKNRYTSGLGVSYNFTDEDNRKIGVGLSAIREKEIPMEGENILQNRLSSNFDLMIKLNKNVTISTTNHYQPNIKQVGDFRWKTNIAFRVNLSPHFLLSINSTFNYDSVPAEGIPETDYQLINSISYTF